MSITGGQRLCGSSNQFVNKLTVAPEPTNGDARHQYMALSVEAPGYRDAQEMRLNAGCVSPSNMRYYLRNC
jgi:hypothetical protein